MAWWKWALGAYAGLAVIGGVFFPPPAKDTAPAAAPAGPQFGRLLAGRGEAFPGKGAVHLVRVTAADTGGADRWPVTAPEAFVGCLRGAPGVTALVVVEGRPFALNGTTRSWARRQGYRLEINGAAVDVATDDMPDWWRAGDAAPRVNIAPLFDLADRMGCLHPA